MFRNCPPLLIALYAFHCSVTSLVPLPETSGTPVAWSRSIEQIRARAEGPIRFQKITVADWEVDRGGLINLKHPTAVAAGLQPGPEPIQIFSYVVDHPERGLFLIDTGMGAIFRGPADEWPVSSVIKSFMKMDALKIRITTGEFLASAGRPVAGVFLTHMHLDHILGAGDLPVTVPIYVGPNEATLRQAQNTVVQGTTDRLLGPDRALRVLTAFKKDSAEPAVLDFFGDGSFFVIHVPGHTAGSLAFVVLAADGRHLILGDTSHTKWGWEHLVPPGDFTSDQAENATSLGYLKDLAGAVGPVTVHPGHQSL